MARYRITYIDSGTLHGVTLDADNADEARADFRAEYGPEPQILEVYKVKNEAESES